MDKKFLKGGNYMKTYFLLKDGLDEIGNNENLSEINEYIIYYWLT